MSLLKRLFRSPTPQADADFVAVPGRDAAFAAMNESIASGRYGAALRIVSDALVDDPADTQWLVARGSTLLDWGRAREARDAFLHAHRLGSRDPDLLLKAGWSYVSCNNHQDAETWMREAVALDGNRSDAHYGLAVALFGQKRLDEAAKAFERALPLCVDDFQCRIAYGNCKIEQGDGTAAEAQFRQAIACNGANAVAWAHLGVALDRQGRVAEALAAYQEAARLEQPADGDADIFVNLSISLRDAGRNDDAIALLEQNLRDRPSIHGYRTYGMMLLAAGRSEDAWPYYEFRWLHEPQLSARPKFQRLAWTGQDLRGKTILLHVEQGLGDNLQFVRYAPYVKALGATVFLVTSRAILNLARTVSGVDRVLGPGEVSPDFEFYVHLLGVPRVFGTTLASIPSAVPYLHAEATRVREAQAEVSKVAGTDLKVGLVWSGAVNNGYNLRRAISLTALAPMLDLPGVRFFSLQKSGEGSSADDASHAAKLASLELRNDFDGTAALITALDLVVSVDTSLAHLAGALGKPVWLLLPTSPHWAWMNDRNDSPWYPTMRLFRQTRRGEWVNVVERLTAAMHELVHTGPRNAPSLPLPLPALNTMTPLASLPRNAPGHRPGFAAVAETRHGILQYLPDEQDEGDALGWYGEWLEPRLVLLERLVRTGMTLLEVGAGVGAHTVLLGKLLEAAGHLVLYEPRPAVQRILRANLSVNNVTNVTLMRGSLGGPDADGDTIDQLQLERLDWLKINDAASAAGVLAGATETLWSLRPNLMLSATDEPALARLAGTASEFGYRCWRHEAALFNAANHNQRGEDIFGGRTALALLAIPEELDVGVALDGCVEIGTLP